MSIAQGLTQCFLNQPMNNNRTNESCLQPSQERVKFGFQSQQAAGLTWASDPGEGSTNTSEASHQKALAMPRQETQRGAHTGALQAFLGPRPSSTAHPLCHLSRVPSHLGAYFLITAGNKGTYLPLARPYYLAGSKLSTDVTIVMTTGQASQCISCLLNTRRVRSPPVTASLVWTPVRPLRPRSGALCITVPGPWPTPRPGYTRHARWHSIRCSLISSPACFPERQ